MNEHKSKLIIMTFGVPQGLIPPTAMQMTEIYTKGLGSIKLYNCSKQVRIKVASSSIPGVNLGYKFQNFKFQANIKSQILCPNQI